MSMAHKGRSGCWLWQCQHTMIILEESLKSCEDAYNQNSMGICWVLEIYWIMMFDDHKKLRFTILNVQKKYYQNCKSRIIKAANDIKHNIVINHMLLILCYYHSRALPSGYNQKDSCWSHQRAWSMGNKRNRCSGISKSNSTSHRGPGLCKIKWNPPMY